MHPMGRITRMAESNGLFRTQERTRTDWLEKVFNVPTSLGRDFTSARQMALQTSCQHCLVQGEGAGLDSSGPHELMGKHRCRHGLTKSKEFRLATSLILILVLRVWRGAAVVGLPGWVCQAGS